MEKSREKERQLEIAKGLKAKKKKVEAIALDDLGIDVTPRIKVEEVLPPEERAGGTLVADVDELIDKLRNESKVL